MRHLILPVTLLILLAACRDGPPAIDTTNLLLSAAPDGRHIARLDEIIGGPPMGGAVLWQELRIVAPTVAVHAGQSDTALVLRSNQEDGSPCVSVIWLSSTKLLVRRKTDSTVTHVNSSVDSIQVVYEEPNGS